MTEVFIHLDRLPAGALHMDVSVAVSVAEVRAAGTPGAVCLADLDALIGELAAWRAVGRFCGARRAVGLWSETAAPTATRQRGWHWTVDYHRQALMAMSPAEVDIDVSVDADLLHASAEAFSVTGLILGETLPGVIAHARRALARLPRRF